MNVLSLFSLRRTWLCWIGALGVIAASAGYAQAETKRVIFGHDLMEEATTTCPNPCFIEYRRLTRAEQLLVTRVTCTILTNSEPPALPIVTLARSKDGVMAGPVTDLVPMLIATGPGIIAGGTLTQFRINNATAHVFGPGQAPAIEAAMMSTVPGVVAQSTCTIFGTLRPNL